MGSPVSPIAANIFMEALEQQAIATAPPECKPKLWLRYVDDILEVINKDQVEALTDHINKVDKSGSIKFTYETESDGKLPFLDTHIVKKDDGSLKLQVYRKPTHTDQYLNYTSHHPLHQKLGVIRTLYDRKESIVTDLEDKIEEEKKIEKALETCGYPKWTFDKVKQQRQSSRTKKVEKKDETNKCTGMVVLPYVNGVTERISRVLKSYNVATAMKPHNTLRSALVHPKDKREDVNKTDALYSLPCMNCDREYIGETGRKFGTRLNEHRTEVEKVSKSVITRASRKESLSTVHKSAVTDHVVETNHVIGWGKAKVIGTEQDRYRRWIKEAIEIRKRGDNIMNRDEGQYFLSHVYDELLKKSPDKKSTGNSKPTTTRSSDAGVAVSSQC